MKFLIICALFILHKFAVTEVIADTRIVKGQPAELKQFPWQAALHDANGNLMCGGSLIDPQWILTAAHCAESPDNRKVNSIRLGTTTSVVTDVQPPAQLFKPIEIHKNELWVSDDFWSPHDICVIKLDHTVNISDYVRTISLDGDYVEVADTAIIMGWGKTADYSYANLKLDYALVKVVSDASCPRMYHAICVVGPNMENACSGDSGGPLVKYYNETKSYRQGGVANFAPGVEGMPTQTDCSSGRPSGYARVSDYIPWIRGIVPTVVVEKTEKSNGQQIIFTLTLAALTQIIVRLVN